MRKMKKALSALVLTAALVVTAVPTVMPVSRVEAAPSPIKMFDFNNGTGMSSSGISGSTEPTVVDDSERGKVLKFAQGESSTLVQMADDPTLGEYDMAIDMGTPSSLSFANPFSGKSLSGVTISYWLKIPSLDAASLGAGIVGFMSESKTIVHPDKLLDTTGSKQDLEDAHGPFSYGISCAYLDAMAISELPMVYFCGLHHNTYNWNEPNAVLADYVNKWVFVTVTQDNSNAHVYFDGKEIEGEPYKNKRWNDGEVNKGSTGNVGQPKFTDIITDSTVKAYVGFTGFSPTVEGVCIDDLMFFDSVLSAADVDALYASAKSGGVASTGNTSTTQSDAAAAEEARRKAAEEAAKKEAEAKAANKALTDEVVASVKVTGMEDAQPVVTGLYRGEDAYTALVGTINGVTLRAGYRASNIVGLNVSFGGSQPETVATVSMKAPSGFDASLMEVVRINADGTVSKLSYTVADGVITAKTNQFATLAIVSLEAGTGRSSNLPNTGVVATGVVVAVGVVAVACGAVLVTKKRKAVEA